MSSAPITLEFLGIPRQRAARAELRVQATTVADALAAAVRTCPGLAGLVGPDGQLAPHYLVSLEGRHFVTDLQQQLQPGARLLVLSADAGG